MSPTEHSPSGFFLFCPFLCRFPIRQGALHVRKGYPELVIPSSQGWGIGLQNLALTPPPFFCSVSFSMIFYSPHVWTNYHLPYPGHVVAYMCSTLIIGLRHSACQAPVNCSCLTAFVGKQANLLMYLQEPPRGDGASGRVNFLWPSAFLRQKIQRVIG